MKKLTYAYLFFFSFTFYNCEKPEKGCTQNGAINYSFTAEEDDGSCEFSTVVFYGTTPANCPPVVVTVDGQNVGTIDAFYPTGPGNCSVPGVARYSFKSNRRVDWIAQDGCGRIASGTTAPNRSNQCIGVRVF